MTALLFCVVVTLLGFQTVDRPAVAPVEKGEIRGRVTDQETGLPLARVNVHLYGYGPGQRGAMVTTTNDAGVFRFAGLAAGQYNGMVEPGFRGTHLSRAVTAGRPPITLAKDETREVSVALPRARAINVRVVDPWGEPLSGLSVGVRSADTEQLAVSMFMPSQRTTDDKGRLRIFGLASGRYIVCADIDVLGAPGEGSAKQRDRLLRTCYPSAGDEREAEPIRLDRSDTGELEIRMRQGRTFTIAGRVVDASGEPPVGALVGLTHHYLNGSGTRGIRVDTDGRFRVQNVHPGSYSIEVSRGGPDRPEQRRPLEAAFLPVRVESADVEELLVLMKKGVDVAGRIRLEDPALVLPPASGSGLMVNARLADDRVPGSGSSRYTTAAADRTFTIKGSFGPRVLEFMNVPRGWYVKSVLYGGNEIIDQPTEFKDTREPPALDVVFSNRGAVVTGRVVDDRGNPVRAQVIMLRTRENAPVRLAASAVASATGAFRLGPGREGEYAIVALPAGSPYPQAGEWDRMARLAALGERITLVELDERTMDLRVTTEK